jgi:hypothetical protein
LLAARAGLEPSPSPAVRRHPLPWPARQGAPLRPYLSTRTTPLGSLRARATFASNPSPSHAAIAELGAPHRAAVPLLPLDDFNAPKVRVVVRILSSPFALSLSPSCARKRSPLPPSRASLTSATLRS